MTVGSGSNNRCQTEIRIDDRCQFQERGLRPNDRGGLRTKDHFHQEDVRPSAFGYKTFSPSQSKMSIYAKEFLAIYFDFMEYSHILWGSSKPKIVLTVNKSVTRFFQTTMIPSSFWDACDFVLQFHFKIAHVPGKMNTAADFLSRLDINPKDELLLQIREDI